MATAYGYFIAILFTDQNLSSLWSLDAFSWSFIMLVPYTIGILSTIFYVFREKPLSLWEAIILPWLSVGGLAIILLFLSFGLLLCFIIATPIFFPAASLGGFSVWLIRKKHKWLVALLVISLFSPFGLNPVEARFDKERVTVHTLTTIEISADVETVWAEIASVDPITETEHRFNWAHLIGLPRPVAATLSHPGVGGVRDAYFENGLRFDETITEWEDGERIRFDIRETSQFLLPAPLDLIDGETFDVVEGMYEIEQIDDERLILHLSSEHFLTTRFNRYGAFWTDLLMRNLQNYILEIVKTRAEAQ